MNNIKHSLEPEERRLADYIPLAGKLEDVRRYHHNIVAHLISIREGISQKVNDLQGKHQRTFNRKETLKNQIDAAKAKKAKSEQMLEDIKSWRTQLAEASEEKAKLQGSLDSIRISEEKMLSSLLKLERRKTGKKSQNQAIVNQKIAEFDEQKEHIRKEKQQLENELKSARGQENTLIRLLKGADEKEKRAEEQCEDALKRENDLTKKLERAEEEEKNAKQRLDFFSLLANKFYEIYEIFSLSRSTDSDALSVALTDTQWLNLDRIPVSRANEKVLDNVCGIINHSIKELTDRLDLFDQESDIYFTNIKSDINDALTGARNLVHQFDQITVGRYVQELDSALSFCCDQLATNKKRSYIRKNRRSRLHIRYFAKVLAEHLSYWSQKELFSSTNSFDSFSYSQSASRFYFGVYVAFALLEQRIHGNLSASEGILIVRDYTRENHETT